MKMEVQTISKQNVKPSSPTPPHLRNFKLSFLDQLIPVPYAPILLFYPMNEHTNNLEVPQRLELFKKSLTETLTHFYPLAGKINDELSIDCNDEGAYYVEAQVNCHLNEFLRQPDLLLAYQFFPCELLPAEPRAVTYVANFQVNVFECGGIAIGICISHLIVDGSALSTFIKAWSATAKGGNEAIICPEFVAASSLFPANDLWIRDSAIVMFGSLFKKGKCITKRFVFDSSAISNLKAQAASLGVKCPTRVEVVSSFLWKCIMAAAGEWRGSQRPSLLTHLVNLRRKMEPKLSENSMGNFLWLAAAKYMNESKAELNDLVGEMRKAISKIDADFVAQIKSHRGNPLVDETFKGIGEFGFKDGVDYLGFSSWCRFGFYDADFGWGKPVWVSSYGVSGSLVMNLIVLVDTRFDGIEAWVTLDEKDMTILQGNPELLKLASLDPSPLDINKIKDQRHVSES